MCVFRGGGVVVAGGGVGAVFFSGSCASGLPHWGQNVACRRTSALHLGQRMIVVAAVGCAGDLADVSRDAWSVVTGAFCILSKSSGKSGCVLCASTGRGVPVVGGWVDSGNAARTLLRSLLKSAVD